MAEWKKILVASGLVCLAAATSRAEQGPGAQASPSTLETPAPGDEKPTNVQAPGEKDPTLTTQPTTPEAKVVAAFNQSLLSLLGGSKDFDARYATIEPVLKKSFDLEFMAAKVLGRGWKELTAEQQEQWLAAFTRLTASNYAGRFVGETGPSFENHGEQAGSHDTVVVMTTLIDPKGEDVELNYRMRETPSGWKVIDCYMNGTVSEIALRRSEYGSVLRRDGFEALVRAVDEKSDALAAAPPTT